jgi:hypothetical protein
LSPHFPRWVFFYCESAPESGMPFPSVSPFSVWIFGSRLRGGG